MNRQGYIVRNRTKRPMFLAAGIREQASRLPELYAQRDKKAFQDKQIKLGESELKLGQQRLQMEKKQFKKSQKMEREAQDVAAGGMMLKGGLGLASAGFQTGMFDQRMDQLKAGWKDLGSTKQGTATGDRTVMDRSGMADNPTQQGTAPSSFGRFGGGEWKAGAFGGATGGFMGAGAAKAMGARKKWQTMAAGAAGGMFSTWMAGSSNPWSMALGGLLGGGIGALF